MPRERFRRRRTTGETRWSERIEVDVERRTRGDPKLSFPWHAAPISQSRLSIVTICGIGRVSPWMMERPESFPTRSRDVL
jgi:hypothetical protein